MKRLFVLLFVTYFFSCFFEKKEFKIGIAQWVSNDEFERNVQGFKDELAKKGYQEGQNITFDIKICNADKTAQIAIINKFKNDKVDLVYSLTTPGTIITKEIIKDIPIVFSIVTYPVEADIIKSLDKSECNAVGTRNYISPANQYYTFETLVDNIKKIAFVHRKGEVNSTIQFNEFKKLLSIRGVELVEIAAVSLEDIHKQLLPIIDELDGIYSACDTLIQSGGEEVIIKISSEHKIPTFTCNKDGVLKGALVGNVADFYAIGKISGEKAAIILKGAKPQWLTTESPRKEYIMINENTAQLLKLEIPSSLREEAERIIK